jgi:hypothetical protein
MPMPIYLFVKWAVLGNLMKFLRNGEGKAQRK